MAAVGILEREQAVVPLQAAVGIHQPGVHGGRGAEIRDLFGELVEHGLEELERAFGDRAGVGQSGENAVAHLRRRAER